MNVLVLTYGTRGDVQPYVALALGLRAAGHDVTLAAPARFRGFVESHGLAFGPLSDEMLDLLATPEGRALLERCDTPARIAAKLPDIFARIGPMQDTLLLDSWEIARDLGPDVILYHPKTFGGPHIAERIGCPAILTLPVPYLVPTGEEPNTIFPELPLGPGYNLLTYYAVGGLLGLWSSWYEMGLRRNIGLPMQHPADRWRLLPGHGVPAIHAVSPHVVPRPADWPPEVTMSGYWFLDTATGWTPPPALAAFLAAGPPPVYIGFGSMAGEGPNRLGRVVTEALLRTGLRAVVSTGWGGLKLPDPLPDTIFALAEAPHDWLFPRMAGVVHHGGAGTTAAALRAGRPNLVVPFFGDQPFWGKRVHKLGAGPRPIPQEDLTADKLAAALHEITSRAAMCSSAEAIGQKLRDEDGVGNAIGTIETLVDAWQYPPERSRPGRSASPVPQASLVRKFLLGLGSRGPGA